MPSAMTPLRAQTLPREVSISWPIVIREGKEWVFTMRSGVNPSSMKGMSLCWSIVAQMFLFPEREESLSPTRKGARSGA